MDRHVLEKKKWREQILKQRAQLSDEEWLSFSAKILEQLTAQEYWQKAQHIATYYSFNREVDTVGLIKTAWQEKKQIYVPRADPQTKQMHFYHVESLTQLEQGYAGIWEPKVEECSPLKLAELDLIIVPGLVFDRLGYRIGYGGGYYDRFLAKLSDKVTRISLAFPFQVVSSGELPIEATDIPVQYILTGEVVLVCEN